MANPRNRLRQDEEERIRTFWSRIDSLPKGWAKGTSAEIFSQGTSKNFQAAARALQDVHPELFLTLGPHHPRPEFIISANGDASLFQLVFRIIDAASESARESLDIRGLRPAQGFGGVIRLGDKVLAPNEVRYRTYPAGAHLDIDIFAPGFRHLLDPESDRLGSAIFLLLDHAIGEYNVATLLGAVNFRPLEEATPDSLPLPTLAHEIDRFASLPHIGATSPYSSPS